MMDGFSNCSLKHLLTKTIHFVYISLMLFIMRIFRLYNIFIEASITICLCTLSIKMWSETLLCRDKGANGCPRFLWQSQNSVVMETEVKSLKYKIFLMSLSVGLLTNWFSSFCYASINNIQNWKSRITMF